MARTIKDEPKVKKDTRTKVAVKNIEKVQTGEGVELWHIKRIYDELGPEFISKPQLNKLKKQGHAKKSGGTVKRKSGGKMNTDGNSYVSSLYKGGKIGG